MISSTHLINLGIILHLKLGQFHTICFYMSTLSSDFSWFIDSPSSVSVINSCLLQSYISFHTLFLQYFIQLQDWPDDMQMSDDAFADYAATLEKQDFEDDVRGLSSTLHQLVTAREDTIYKLRASADYLDSIWTR